MRWMRTRRSPAKGGSTLRELFETLEAAYADGHAVFDRPS
jgi:hypothetical protein